METLSCHSNQSSYPTGTKNYKLPWQPEFLSSRNKNHNFLFPPPVDAMCVIRKESATQLQRTFENIDVQTTADRHRMPVYTKSSQVGLWLR